MSFRLQSFTKADLPPILLESSRLTVQSPSVSVSTQDDMAKGQRASASTVAFFDQVNLDEALQLYSVVRTLHPENTLEIGFCSAGSGLAILKALEDGGKGMHHAVDPFQTTYAMGQGRYNVAAAGLAHRLCFFETYPEDAIAKIPRVQFAFIDASHLYDLSMLDFVLADKRLDEGGIMALHDLWMPSLQKLVRYILTNRHYEILDLEQQRPAARPRLMHGIKQTWSRSASKVPFLRKLLAPEVLHPWSLYNSPNLLFLRKLKEDDRAWSFHQTF